MAVAIEILIGPGKGWKYVLAAEEVRVGRGAGHQVKLDDPAWGGGHLRVQFRQGGYVVTNRMGHPVLLDSRPLADGEQATWFTGVCLQPTGGTLLRLAAAEPPSGADTEAGVIPVAPGVSVGATRKKQLEWVALGVILLAAAGLFAKDQFQATPPTDGEVLEHVLRPELARDLTEPQTERLVLVIRKGLVCRSQGDHSGAKRKYDEARRLIAEANGGRLDKLPPSLAKANKFVAERDAELKLD